MELDASEAPALDISGVYRGIEAVRQWWQEWFAAWESLQFEYELVDAGGRAVMLLDLRMRGRSTGIEVPLGKHAWVTTFRDGLMVHSKLYMNQAEALKPSGCQRMPTLLRSTTSALSHRARRSSPHQPSTKGWS
jgi:SnoaL-like domain